MYRIYYYIFVVVSALLFATHAYAQLNPSGGGVPNCSSPQFVQGPGVCAIPAGSIVAGSSPAILQYSGNNSALVAPATVSGDGTMALGGALTVTKSNGTTILGMAFQAPGAVAITGGSITGLGSPVNPSDVAIKSYVDAATTVSTTWHTAVMVATAAALPNTPTYANGSSGVGATLTAGSNIALTVDGQSVGTLAERVLVQNQASAFQNGIYTLTQAGTGSVPWILTRATDFNTVGTGNVATGAAVLATTGTANAGFQFWMNQTAAITIGTTAITWAQISGSSLVAGSGIQFVANAITLGNIGNDTVLGNVSGSSGVPSGLTQAQLTALINPFTSSLPGAVPASGGGTANFLRADATWQPPSPPTLTPVSKTTNYNVTISDNANWLAAAGASSAITFALPNPGTAPNNTYQFRDSTGFGYVLTTAAGTANLAGNFYGGAATSQTLPANAVVVCDDATSQYVCVMTVTPISTVVNYTSNATPLPLPGTNDLQELINQATPAALTVQLPSTGLFIGFHLCVKDFGQNFAKFPAHFLTTDGSTIDGQSGSTGFYDINPGDNACFKYVVSGGWMKQ